MESSSSHHDTTKSPSSSKPIRTQNLNDCKDDDDAKQSESPATSVPTTLTANELKEKGNVCVRNNNYEDALQYYTQAIKLNSNDPALYSNRSLVFLKLKQYYYASNDADTVIQLNSQWAKGHYRKAEILTAIGHYDSALLHYGRALQLQQGDRSILQAAQKAATLENQQTEYERRLPWVGAGIGIIIGVIISLCDTLLTVKPTLKHPAMMVLLVFVIAGIGYIIARSIRYYQRIHIRSLLEPPLNINEEYQNPFSSSSSNSSNFIDKNIDGSDNNETTTNRTRYSKAQARLRFKKGKS